MFETDERKGRIFDIQRFSIHDGPGIRTVVFLKGCILRCRWCCNPESQSYEIEQMVRGGKVRTMGRDVTVREVMETVLRDMPYYRRSGGGLTLSGGECLCQPDFSEGLLSSAHDHGITTAIETIGFAPQDVLSRIIPLCDTVLMDIKHTDSEKHAFFCGRRNDVALENAPLIARMTPHLIIRVPVIPGFNDTEEEILSIATFAARIPEVQEMHLLPYHRLGQDKYAGLGRPYALDGIPPHSQAKMEYLLSVAERSGLRCQIGG